MTMDELKPCSICGKPAEQMWDPEEEIIRCSDQTNYCHNSLYGMYVNDWQSRPIEDALNVEISRLKSLLDKAHDCIGSVVACCTYSNEQSAKTGAYGISPDAFTKIDAYMRNVLESDWNYKAEEK